MDLSLGLLLRHAAGERAAGTSAVFRPHIAAPCKNGLMDVEGTSV
jgi:hypothetical protein